MPLFLKERKSFLILLALVFIQLVLISLQAPLEENNYFERTVFSVFSPIQHGLFSFFRKVSDIWNGYFYLKDVKKDNEKLKEEIFSLRQENDLLRKAIENLRGERKMRETLSNLGQNILAARVIGLDHSNVYKSVIINKGSIDGVKKEMVVLDKQGRLVGRVVGPVAIKESRIQLITDPESGVSVYSQPNRVQGIVSGDGRGRCVLKYILSTNEELQKGDSLITSGFDGIFPSGIPVGKVISVVRTTSLFHDIRVKPYFDFRDLEPVAVLRIRPTDLY
jgi:rod shape-determining protein MreC